jgi:hypothetical protein
MFGDVRRPHGVGWGPDAGHGMMCEDGSARGGAATWRTACPSPTWQTGWPCIRGRGGSGSPQACGHS